MRLTIKNTKNGMMKNDNYQVNVEQIIEFVQKSIDEGYDIYVTNFVNGYIVIINEDKVIDITFSNSEIRITSYREDSKYCRRISTGYIKLEINEEDYLKLQLLQKQLVRRDSENLFNIMNNFFKKEKKKVKDINDLDDEEK